MSLNIDLLQRLLLQVEALTSMLQAELNAQNEASNTSASTSVTVGTPRKLSIPEPPPPLLTSLIARALEKKPFSSVEQGLLEGISALENAGAIRAHRTLVAATAGYGPFDGVFVSALDALVEEQLLSITGSSIVVTEVGRELLPRHRYDLTSESLLNLVVAQLPTNQKRILQYLFTTNGKGVHVDVLAGLFSGRLKDGRLYKELQDLERQDLVIRSGNKNYACGEMLYLGK